MAPTMALSESWDDDDAAEPVMPDADEEKIEFRHAAGPAAEANDDADDEDPLTSFPAVMVDLTPLIAEHSDDGHSVARIREAVLDKLNADWSANLAELMEQGLAWHVPRRESKRHREEHEARFPGSVLSIFEYPAELGEGQKTAAMWRLICRPTPAEACDAIKAEVARARRPLRWQADIAEEVEMLAEQEHHAMEVRRDAQHGLDAATEQRQSALEAMHNAHTAADAVPLTPQQVQSMLDHLNELDEYVEEARSLVEDTQSMGGPAADDDDQQTLVDLLLDAIFQFHPGVSAGEPEPTSWLEQQIAKAERKGALRRMWRSFFGRLPLPSELALKHAPRKPAQRGAEAAASAEAGGADDSPADEAVAAAADRPHLVTAGGGGPATSARLAGGVEGRRPRMLVPPPPLSPARAFRSSNEPGQPLRAALQ
jgi:hypothetical protein